MLEIKRGIPRTAVYGAPGRLGEYEKKKSLNRNSPTDVEVKMNKFQVERSLERRTHWRRHRIQSETETGPKLSSIHSLV